MNRSTTPGGVPYEFRYTPRRKKSPPTLTVSVAAANRYSYDIRPEGLSDRAAKSFGVSEEHQTGDIDFDSQYYLGSDAPGGLRFVFGDPGARQCVKEIFALGPRHVYQKKGKLTAYWSPFREGDETARARAAAEILSALAPHSTRVPETIIDSAVHGETLRFGAYVFTGVLLFFSFLLLIYSAATYPVFETNRLLQASLSYSLPAFGALALVMFFLLRGRASSHRELTIVLILLAFGSIMLGIGGLTYGNGAFDRSEPNVRQVLVLEKYSRKPKKSGRKYYVSVNSWRMPGVRESLEVSQQTHDLAVPNSSTGTVKTKPGKYGYEWTYESFRLGGQ